MTVFGSNTFLTKHPLVFLDDKVNPVTPGPHWQSNARVADFTCVLFHYKLLAGHLHKQAAQASERTAKGSARYKKYLEVLEKDLSASIKTDTSKELKSVNDLVGTRFVSVSRKYMRFVEREERRNDHYSEKRRSERLFEAFFNAQAEVTALTEQVETMREQNKILRRKYREMFNKAQD